MNRTKHILLTFTLLLSSLAVSAAPVQIDGIWYNLVSSTKVAEVTCRYANVDEKLNEYPDPVTIPAKVTYQGVEYRVTSIAEKTVAYCGLTSITIPESVVSIGANAFYN